MIIARMLALTSWEDNCGHRARRRTGAPEALETPCLREVYASALYGTLPADVGFLSARAAQSSSAQVTNLRKEHDVTFDMPSWTKAR